MADRVQERYVATTVCIYPVYTLLAFGQRCCDAGVRPSMGSVGDYFDNAMCESFFATLECELLDRTSFKIQAEEAHGGVRLHRRVVRSPSSHLRARLSLAHRF